MGSNCTGKTTSPENTQSTSLTTPIQRRQLCSSLPPETWLDKEISKQKESMKEKPFIPMKDNGEHYQLNDLYEDQQYIAHRVLGKVKDFLTRRKFDNFKPLRCTINGQGGTGKSVLINTIVSVLRRFSNNNNIVFASAPTGTAAFNVNGQTIHSLTGQGCEEEEKPASKAKLTDLKNQFFNTLVLIIDERSMISSSLLAKTESIVSRTLFQGRASTKHSWGGIPVVILAGDDYQLGSISEGAHDAIGPCNKPPRTKLILRGRELFKELGKTVFKLQKIRRINESRQKDMELLERLRIGEHVLDSDVAKLESLHIDTIAKQHGGSVASAIKQNAIFLFYTNEKRIHHNLTMLSQLNSDANPTAICPPQSSSSKHAKAVERHFESAKSKCTGLLCRGCKVSINGRNFFPLWGLHNGACGTVEEIVFKKGTSPNEGHLPIYVIVNFLHYRGPPWDKNNPTSIPIPTVESRCRWKCCKRVHIPLDLSFARTIHTFQGLSAGPTEPGKPNTHMYQHIICDPHDRDVESTQTGMLYTAVSRGTTLGDDNGLNSAIYFTGSNINPDRIQKLTRCRKQNNEYTKVKKRRIWVQYLEQHTVTPDISQKGLQKISKTFNYFTDKNIARTRLMNRCLQYTQTNKKTKTNN